MAIQKSRAMRIREGDRLARKRGASKSTKTRAGKTNKFVKDRKTRRAKVADSALAQPTEANRGILPVEEVHHLARSGAIQFAEPPINSQFQPASLDLRLGATAYRVRASFLPGNNFSVHEKLEKLALHKIDLSSGAVLERGCVYVVPLMESLALPPGISAAANPKSSTGRLDIFTRVIPEKAEQFDVVPPGYKGALYAEISPRTFPILLRQGTRLSQIRFRRGAGSCSDAELMALHLRERLVSNSSPDIQGGLALRVDLTGSGAPLGPGLVGYRARHHTGLIDVDRIGHYPIDAFWQPLIRENGGSLILDPGEFYILASKEAVHVPPAYAAEMVPFNPLVGEFRVHYAGFFDPGFGHSAAGGAGSRAVLEVRSHDVPFILEDGQIVGRLIYEPLTSRPTSLYGASLNSNYQGQGLKLSKHFKNG